MSWFREEEPTWLQKLAINILKEGSIPQHVAIIMDGNRRFATKNSMEQVDGHSHGFERLSMALNWCRKVGIKEVTVYAFSIENFKRSKEEVDRIMELARQKFQTLLDEKEKTMKFGLCVRVLGNLSLLPDDIQQLVAEVMRYSKDNTTEEITSAVKKLAEGVQDGLITPSDVSESLLEKSLYTTRSEPPDLVIRTSGEVRLSDFMLWQAAEEQNQKRQNGDQEDQDFEDVIRECFSYGGQNRKEVKERIGKWKKEREEREERYLGELDRKKKQELDAIITKTG